MKAEFKGYINVQQNACFSVPKFYKGFKVSEKHYELKDDVNADQFIIGEEYEISGLVK